MGVVANKAKRASIKGMGRLAEDMRRLAPAGGRARAAAMSAEERAKMTRAGAAAINSPAGLARRIIKAWPSLSDEQRAEVDEILAGRS